MSGKRCGWSGRAGDSGDFSVCAGLGKKSASLALTNRPLQMIQECGDRAGLGRKPRGRLI